VDHCRDPGVEGVQETLLRLGLPLALSEADCHVSLSSLDVAHATAAPQEHDLTVNLLVKAC
jgi:hypothetical protein